MSQVIRQPVGLQSPVSGGPSASRLSGGSGLGGGSVGTQVWVLRWDLTAAAKATPGLPRGVRWRVAVDAAGSAAGRCEIDGAGGGNAETRQLHGDVPLRCTQDAKLRLLHLDAGDLLRVTLQFVGAEAVPRLLYARTSVLAEVGCKGGRAEVAELAV
ncbi:MAG: hypothetical protein LW650_12015 [Planctomycetaceae bacterium]|jgi:hypothetical protein|nr:hypothetical protein [Phycisphaerales bacterium]MCE2654152.1 hypothetical protein [Planctomycetaceae bacterium]